MEAEVGAHAKIDLMMLIFLILTFTQAMMSSRQVFRELTFNIIGQLYGSSQ